MAFHLRLKCLGFGLLAPILLLTQCARPPQSTQSVEFLRKHSDATYCDIDAVLQSRERSCGAAVLAAVLRYWEKPGSETELLSQDPPAGKIGYPISQLRGMALRRGLWAYALSMEDGKLDDLLQHVRAGRPVIAAVLLPHGRYFGDRHPVLGRVDRRVVKFGPPTEVYKHHYVVVHGEHDKSLLLMDPAYGLVFVSKQEFLSFWKDEKYAALVCSPM